MSEVQVFDGEGIDRWVESVIPRPSLKREVQLVTIGGDSLGMGVKILKQPNQNDMGWELELRRSFENRDYPVVQKLSDYHRKVVAVKAPGVTDYKFDMKVNEDNYRGCFVTMEEIASTIDGDQWVTYKIQADMRV